MESSVSNDGYVPPATAFTVHFDADTPKLNGSSHLNNKFTRRHIRNLSLPLAKVYDNKVANEENKSFLNGKVPRRAGNHSEGYFSSDTEEDPTASQKLFVKKVLNVDKKVSNPTKVAQEKRRMTGIANDTKFNKIGNGHNDDEEDDEDDDDADDDEEEEGLLAQKRITENEEEEDDDAASETGTYTIEKDNEEVTTARLNIDAAFGIREEKNSVPMKFLTNSAESKSTWVNDWATQVVEHNSLTLQDPTPSPKIAQVSSLSNNSSSNITKIPSPINLRARPLSAKTASEHSRQTTVKRRSASMNRQVSGKPPPPSQEECSDSSLETESFLLATERLVSAMAARVSLSLDSGGESDVDTSHSQRAATATALAAPSCAVAGHQRSDSSASEESAKRSAARAAAVASVSAASTPAAAPTTTRYNRAFSIRRARLDEPTKKPVAPAADRTKRTPVISPAPKAMAPVAARVMKAKSPAVSKDTPPPSASAFSRTDCGRFSMRTSKSNLTPSSPLLSAGKKEVGGAVKKKPGGGGGRSNSTLSSKEVEFQNWKRRKSYDPMKAAAEGKKKEAAAKKQHYGSGAAPPSAVMTNSATTPKSPVNPVLRSASFHGTRQLTMPSSSDEEEEEEEEEEDEEEGEVEAPVVEDEDWPAPSAPRTSLESTPRGSRVSLYSNTSNSSLRTRPKLEGVDNLVISALSGLSAKLKIGSCGLLKKLRYLYDEDSPKAHQLSAEIEQLEASEPCSPQVKSPSRELSTTLRNLKRIESMIKVLDEVLFDDGEFQ